MLEESLESAVASRAGVVDSHMFSATVALSQIVIALAGDVNASVVPQHVAAVISQDQGPSQLRVMHSALGMLPVSHNTPLPCSRANGRQSH